MNLKLNQITNWPELIRQSNWSIAALAKQCGVSRRSLHRHFLETQGKSPQVWMQAQRKHMAMELLHESSSIKETAECLGYEPSSFSHWFKQVWGICPTLVTSLSPEPTRCPQKANNVPK